MYGATIKKKRIFSTDFGIVLKSNFIGVLPEGAKLSYADGNTDGRANGKTDMTELTVAFHNFVNSPK